MHATILSVCLTALRRLLPRALHGWLCRCLLLESSLPPFIISKIELPKSALQITQETNKERSTIQLSAAKHYTGGTLHYICWSVCVFMALATVVSLTFSLSIPPDSLLAPAIIFLHLSPAFRQAEATGCHNTYGSFYPLSQVCIYRLAYTVHRWVIEHMRMQTANDLHDCMFVSCKFMLHHVFMISVLVLLKGYKAINVHSVTMIYFQVFPNHYDILSTVELRRCLYNESQWGFSLHIFCVSQRK